MEQFNYRIGNIEARACDKHLVSIDEPTTIKIVKWDDEGGYTLAYWKKQNDSFDLQFLGGRPFVVDPETFFRIAKEAQKFLDEEVEGEDG